MPPADNLEFSSIGPEVRHIFVARNHAFIGRSSSDAASSSVFEIQKGECRAGSGLIGDRYCNYKPDHKGQITFFSEEVHRAICKEFSLSELPVSVYRRNVIVTGLDLNSLIGEDFELGGVRFRGTEEARPCKWMNAVVADGARVALQGRGGLRAKILTNGELVVGSCVFKRFES